MSRDWNEQNRKVIAEFRANGGTVKGWPNRLLILTTTGAKSGLPREIPLVYSTDGDRYVVIASKGGAPTNPDWYYNLVAHPELTVEVGTERFTARAREADGAERDRLYDQQAALMPFFKGYQEGTERRIPVFVIERGEG